MSLFLEVRTSFIYRKRLKEWKPPSQQNIFWLTQDQMVRQQNKKTQTKAMAFVSLFPCLKKVSDWSNPASASSAQREAQQDQGAQTVVQGCTSIQFPSAAHRNWLLSPSLLIEFWIGCVEYKGSQLDPLKSHFILHEASWQLHEQERWNWSHLLLSFTSWSKAHLSLCFWGTQGFTPS